MSPPTHTLIEIVEWWDNIKNVSQHFPFFFCHSDLSVSAHLPCTTSTWIDFRWWINGRPRVQLLSWLDVSPPSDKAASRLMQMFPWPQLNRTLWDRADVGVREVRCMCVPGRRGGGGWGSPSSPASSSCMCECGHSICLQGTRNLRSDHFNLS